MPRTLTVVDQSYRTARRVARASIAVSGILACSNITIGLLAQSTSVVATEFEFAGDVLTSSIVVIGMGVAARPADDNHPYGHGRFETLSAFMVGVILAAGGVLISYHSLQAIGARHAPPGVTAAAALVGAIILRGIMSSVKFRVGLRLRSSALIADAWNDAVDILSALAALAVALAMYDPVRFLVVRAFTACGQVSQLFQVFRRLFLDDGTVPTFCCRGAIVPVSRRRCFSAPTQARLT